jgi:endo-1,4-beta-xylanase
MAQIMQNHVRDTMKYWRGRLIQQDVVNEPASGQGLQPTIYYRKLGETYIDLAFQAAVEGDPNCLRVINQDWIELDSSEHNRRRAVFIALLERLKKRNVPIQCVGIEGHLQTKYKFNEKLWRAFCDEVVGMGYKLMITEYDVNDAGSTGGPHQHDADAASLMHDFLAVTLSYPQCIGLISQSYTDHYTWLKPFSAGLGQAPTQPRPSPLDADYQRKPMWDAIVAAIKSAPLRT